MVWLHAFFLWLNRECMRDKEQRECVRAVAECDECPMMGKGTIYQKMETLTGCDEEESLTMLHSGKGLVELIR